MTTIDGNNHTQDGLSRPTVAERHREAYQRPALTRLPARPGLWAKLRPWAIGAAAGLAIGGAAAFGLAYKTMPMKATAVERVFADVNGDGAPDFIVNAWVVFGPKAPGQ